MIAIAGSTGYLGRLLALELRSRGAAVRALARRPESAADLAAAGCEVVRADVLEPDSLSAALSDVKIAYYLVHSMGRGSGGDFAELDRRGAKAFATTAADCGVERIIYLGGLGEGQSKHLRSRQETAEALAASGVPLTYFRAAIVIGSGSESLRTIVYLVRRLPAMITPRWTVNQTQPIGARDIVAYLADAIEIPASAGREIEIGGPEVTTYGGLLDIAADALGLRPRPRLGVPILSPKLSSLWVGLVTPVDVGVARPLIEGLATETVVADPSGMELFAIDGTALKKAMQDAVDGKI